MKIFYDKRQSVKENDSFSPSAGKPEQVVESWKQLGIPLELSTFTPLTLSELTLAHDPNYVEEVLNGRRNNGFGNRSLEIANALTWVAGSMVAAAKYSFENRQPSFSPTSGAHHAGYDSGSGFCTFNFLVIAAQIIRNLGAKRVGIIDLDCHWGDGTVDIMERLKLDYIQHYSFGAERVQRGKSAEEWLKSLPERLMEFKGCDLLIYNAGVDPHVNDPLGGKLTTEQLRKRDRIVFEIAKEICPAIATSLAGGYQRDERGTIAPVLRLHDATLRECVQLCGLPIQ